MKLIELLSSDKPTLSCELFPPKPGAALLDAPALVRRIAALHPAYISVTCSAGGSGNGGATTADMANEAQNVNGIPALAHLTCAAATREQVHASLTDLRKLGIENILALRGDIPDGGAFPLPGGSFPGLPGGHFFSRNPPGKLPESPLLFPLVRWEKGEILQVFQKNFH